VTTLTSMAFTDAEGSQHLLDTVAEAIGELQYALACLGQAYEILDEYSGDRLEQQLFRPVQTALGRAKRTHAEFAERRGLTSLAVQARPAGAPSTGAKVLVERAVDAVAKADGALATLQDSMLPVEVGDPQLRAGLAEVRELVDGLRARARDLVRTFGR
jgi:hypothetical protein